MIHQDHFREEFANPATQYFILDTKGAGEHGDVDFFQYQWSRAKYNKVNEGDLCIFRRPGKASETGEFYFFGAAKIASITGDVLVSGSLEKVYPFPEYLFKSDLEEFNWTFKTRGNTWEHFFNQYGMNKITRVDFERLLQHATGFVDEDTYDTEAATEATQSIQGGDYAVDDKEGKRKIRTKQDVFSNKVKTNYSNRCAICLLSTKLFLVGSHIIPWSVNKDIRLDPSNGICLCSFHDKAFDKGYVTVDDAYKLVVTKRDLTDPILNNLLQDIDGKRLSLPKIHKPNKEYLKFHREVIFDKF